jgi:hypothetical protein
MIDSVIGVYQISKINLTRSADEKDWSFTITLSSACKDILLQKINTRVEFRWIPIADGELITEFGWGGFRMVSMFKPKDILRTKIVLINMCANIIEKVSGVKTIEVTPGTFRILPKK